MRHRRATTTLLVGALLLATAGCGARWTDEQSELALQSLTGGGGATGAGASTANGSTAAATGAGAAGTGAAATGTAGAGPAAGSTGAGATGTGGEAAPTGAAAASALPCAAAADAPGVTDTEITLGTMQTLSGPVPGLGASNQAAIQAFVENQNANGGVCGRQLVLRAADDGADNARGRQIVADLEPSIFSFVSGVANGMDGAATVVDSTGLPVVGSVIARGIEASPTYFGINPPPPDLNAVTGKYRFLFEQGVRRAAVVYIAAAAAPQQAQWEASFMRAAGIEVVNEQALPLSTLSYDSAARAVANSGADYLLFLHADAPSASMAQSMQDTGYDGLKFEEYIIAYGSNFPALAGAAAEGVSTWLYALPAEDGGAVPEQAAFLAAMAQNAPDASVDTLAAQGWSSMRLIVDTLQALPGPITRDAFLAQLAATGDFDAGGLFGRVNVGQRVVYNCVVGMIYQDGRWQRLAPASGFLC
jgi:ABC-type branched-subunit amino acid transport system substrate-binding protein